MSKYDKLIKENQARRENVQDQQRIIKDGMGEIAADARRTAAILGNAHNELSEIDAQFLQSTRLDSREDIAFLMLATALQIGRWVLISTIARKAAADLSNKAENRLAHDDKSIEQIKHDKEQWYRDKHSGKNIKGSEHRNWEQIVSNGVPYDVTKGSPLFGINMEGGLHRIHTLGHDPVLGWIFGTMNILSDSITLDKTYLFRSFNVCMQRGRKRWESETTIPACFYEAFDSVREAGNRLPAALFAQAVHLESDKYTKLGLPVPLLEAFDPALASKLYSEGYDTLCLMRDTVVLKAAAIEAATAVFINLIISVLHGFFFDPQKYESRELYEVKTRKILSISNLIASASNVIWVGGNALAGNEFAWENVDIGGLIVTAHRLITDTKFINQVKTEYLEKHWEELVVGEEYSFVREFGNE